MFGGLALISVSQAAACSSGRGQSDEKAIAGHYMAFVWLLQKITNLVLKKLNPKGRTREEILKGVAP